MSATARRLRVLCIAPYPAHAPSVHHRIVALTRVWADHGIDVTLWPFMSARFYRIRRTFGPLATVEKAWHFMAATLRLLLRLPFVRRFDRVIIHREAFPLGPPVIEQLIARLHPHTIFDLDDAMWHSPGDVNQRGRFWDPERVAKIMAAVDVVVAGNEYIRRYAERVARRIVVVPTSYEDLAGARGVGPAPSARVTVVWIGNLGNAWYLGPILPALERAAAQHPFRLRLIGGQDIHDITSQTLEIEHLEWRRDREAAWLTESDIGIMPLSRDGFAEGKCAFKIIQYFSAGLPAVATPVGMNCEVIAHGVNGFLPATEAEWTSSIGTLVADARIRKEMATRARETYAATFTRPAVALTWVQLLRSFTGSDHGQPRAAARPASGPPVA
jgi:glycosyltransferase involved in cell wall biosynthesis